jgi:DNA-binding HxlR family transcriptional regulator
MMYDLNIAERVILGVMQQRGDAALTRDNIERLAQVGSSATFDAAVARLEEAGLVVRHQFSKAVPIQLSLTTEGRSARPPVPQESPGA